MQGSMHRLLVLWAVTATMTGAVTFCGPAASAGISECINGPRRISAGNTRGTGCAFEQSHGYVYVLTNAHVVGSSSTVWCEFWRNGHVSVPIAGRVAGLGERIDDLRDRLIRDQASEPGDMRGGQ
jgi:hypothetical protein